MNCLDCHPEATPAVAVCGRCGAALCVDHAIDFDEPLTIQLPLLRTVTISPPARRIRCIRCAAAEQAQQEALHTTARGRALVAH